VLRSLHWLPVAQRIDFKRVLFVYKSLHGLAPKYISGLNKARLRFSFMLLKSGTVFQKM